MEERKSVLETVQPADALGRLSARQGVARLWWVVGAVIVFFGVVVLVVSILGNTIRGSENVRVPAVLEL